MPYLSEEITTEKEKPQTIIEQEVTKPVEQKTQELFPTVLKDFVKVHVPTQITPPKEIDETIDDVINSCN